MDHFQFKTQLEFFDCKLVVIVAAALAAIAALNQPSALTDEWKFSISPTYTFDVLLV
jgi:hypothetical protein